MGITTALAGRGYRVWIADIDDNRGRALAEDLRAQGAEVEVRHVDTSDPASINEGFDEILAREAGVDALVNSAGVGFKASAGEVEVDDFDRLFAVNIRGPWLCAKKVLPAMVAAGTGSIVNIGSVHAVLTEAKSSTYAATKAALVGLTRGIALDYGGDGIRCNVVHPGSVLTAEECSATPTPDGDRWIDVITRNHQVMPWYIHPVEIGNAVAFLVSDDARSITGQQLVVDGGLTSLLFSRAESGR